MPVTLMDVPLSPGEWIDETTAKDTIYLHHTAGGHDPAGVVAWWNRDGGASRQRVGTAYVIGGKSSRTGDDAHDGRVVRCFPEEHWAYHLGVKGTARSLDRRSIGIELCNYGWLRRSRSDGRFYTYVNHPVPDDQVVELDAPFRGHRFWHRYTDRQLDALAELIADIADRNPVDVRAGLRPLMERESLRMPDGLDVRARQRWLNRHGFTDHEGKALVQDGVDGARTRSAQAKVGRPAFEFQEDAHGGRPGVWTHTNVRKDKFDCSPQPELLAMLKAM